jgi:hypothetical protein
MVMHESPGLLSVPNCEQGHGWSLSGLGIIMTEPQQMIESSSIAESKSLDLPYYVDLKGSYSIKVIRRGPEK